MIIGGKKFDVEHETYVMGILNVTPDSFSDGGKYNGMDQAMEHARQMVEDGADIIDVGGESTRPGHIMITDEEEIARVTPIIEKLKKEFDVPISIDTYKSKVAEAAVQAGADLVNDIWGLKYDEKIADVIAKHNVACCLMHNRDNTEYSNFLDDFMEDMRECIRLAKAAGIASYTADLLIYLLMTAHLKERYQEKGISEQIWLDSCMDLNWKLYECRKMYGIWGSFVSWWFDGFFEMTRFALGRLQFELIDFPESYEKTGHVRPEGMTKVINMHIPSCGPLKKEDCEASFRQAAAFFADAFPGEEIAFFCESWLLYPRHREFLSPDSGIVQFMSFFDIYKTEEGDGDLWRIYNREYDGNPEALPEETTIQRGYKKLLLSGGHAGYGEGIFFRKKKEML